MYRILKKLSEKILSGIKLRYKYIKIIIIIIGILFFSIITGVKLNFTYLFKPDLAILKKEILEINKNTGFSITYDGFGNTFLPGFIFYNTQVKIDGDTQHGALFTVPELILKPDIFQSIRTKKVVPGKIIIKGAHWDLFVNNKDLQNLIEKNIYKVIKEYPEFHIIFENNIISLTFEKRNYERERWNISVKNGRIDSQKGKIISRFSYDDAPWGEGEVEYLPDLCDKCSLADGHIIADVNNLPVNRLSWFFKDYNLVDGKIDFSTDLRISFNKTRTEFSSVSNIIFENILATNQDDKPVLTAKKLRINLDLGKKAEKITSVFSGKINRSVFEGLFEKEGKSILPEKFSFNLENKGKYVFPLYYGYNLKGLTKLNVNIEQSQDRNIYREISGNLDIRDGNLTDINQLVIVEFPQVSLNLESNSFSGLIRTIKGKSDINFEFSGNLVPVVRKILTHIEFDDYTKNKVVEKNSVNWFITETGKFSSNTLLWSDFNEFYNWLKKYWINKVNTDGFKGWRPSILREREWFQNYFMYSNFTNEVFIEKWLHENRNSKKDLSDTVSGNLNFSRSVLDLKLISGENNFTFLVDANSNYPVMRGEVKYRFQDMDDFSMLWLPPKFCHSFSGYDISSIFVTSGESFLDMANNFFKNSDYRFSDIILVSEVEKNKLNWANLDVKIRQYGKKITASYFGDSSDSTINGWGTFNENEAELWKVKNSIRGKYKHPVN